MLEHHSFSRCWTVLCVECNITVVSPFLRADGHFLSLSCVDLDILFPLKPSFEYFASFNTHFPSYILIKYIMYQFKLKIYIFE